MFLTALNFKKMKNLILFLSAILFLLFTNCTKEIEFDAQDIAARIVVNSLLQMTHYGLPILAEVLVY